MLHNLKKLYGHKLTASDGEIGSIKDFYFDDRHWAVRYLVADTGSWLSKRLVLISPHALGLWDQEGQTLAVNLTRQQIENGPSIESHQPVSRQYEIDYYRYYGWPTYWEGGGVWGMSGFPVVMPLSKLQLAEQRQPHHHAEKHLQSARSVTGYGIHATDGEIGSVEGFIVDEKSWVIAELSVATGHWYAGKEVLIPPQTIKRISYEDSQVFVNLTTHAIRQTADNHVVTPGT